MSKNSKDLLKDPDYIQLLAFYQDADFEKCKAMIEKLEPRFPENQDLLQFKEELELKLSFVQSVEFIAREEKRKKRENLIKMSTFAALATVVVAAIFLFVFYLIDQNRQAKRSDSETLQLTSMEYQVEKLLDAGKPQTAGQILEQMGSINDNYENLPELITEKDELLELEADYENALSLVQQDNKSEALEIFKSIEEVRPNIWDVQFQIDQLEEEFLVETLMEEGMRAYLLEDWDTVIASYEHALDVDSGLDDPLMKEHMVQAYLNKIIGLLENENTTIEDIDNAENYYKNALSFVSQNKDFAMERERLQKASSELLILKFSQIAKDALQNKNQTKATISEAVSYLRKASNLDSENQTLGEDLRYAEYYQMAFNNILDRDWDEAIKFFELLLASDPDYANENVNILLFEAYYGAGKRYTSIGLYLDAINSFNKAEVLAWADPQNLLKLFQVQIALGEIYGKLDSSADAVSYYEFALNAIGADGKIPDNSELSGILSDANLQTAYRNYPDAYQKYQTVIDGIDVVYNKTEVEIDGGVCLAFFAAENRSTVDAIIEENDLPAEMRVTFGRTLTVPSIEE